MTCDDDGDQGRLPPERWELLKREAHAARNDAIRQAVIWLAGRPFALLRGLVKAYKARRARREAVRQLHNLDNRMLHDLGIGRSEIESVVRDWDPTRLPRGVPRLPKARRRCIKQAA
jgi:uncharacterized protein YjiS (DUF1127 family)